MHTPRVSRVMPPHQGRAKPFQLKVITPVHIGGRRQQLPQNRFACVGQRCYVLDDLRFYWWLQEQSPQHTRVDHYVSTALERAADRRHLEQCLGVIFPQEHLEDMLKKIEAYHVHLPQPPGQPGHIYSFLRDPSWRPYLPGTALKGAIRTAVLFHVVTHHPDAFAPQLAARATLGRDLVRGALQDLPLRSPYAAAPLAPEAKDILKSVQVGDSAPLRKDALGLHEIKVLSEGKDIGNTGTIPGVHWSGGEHGFRLYAEVIRPEHTTQPLPCTLTVDARALDAYVPGASRMPFRPEQPQTAVEQLLDICQTFADVDTRARYNPARCREQLLDICQTFADRMAQDELDYFVRLQSVLPESTNPAVGQRIQEALKGVVDFYQMTFQREQERERAVDFDPTTFQRKRPNLRLGWGSGLLGTTLWPWLHEAPEDIQRELQGLFPHPERRGAGNSFPKSRKLDVTTNLPLGWCRLEPTPDTP